MFAGGLRSTLEHVPADELAQSVELVHVNVGDALDDTAGGHIDSRDDECQEDAVHGELSMVDFDQGDGNSSNDHATGLIFALLD